VPRDRIASLTDSREKDSSDGAKEMVFGLNLGRLEATANDESAGIPYNLYSRKLSSYLSLE
jgi:hypothetical protein